MPKDDISGSSKNGGDENLDDISWDDIGDDNTFSEEDEATQVKAPSANTGRSAEFSELKEGGVKSSPGSLDFIMDIPLEVTVELGRTTLPIYDLLQLGQGSIVELSKVAGEPLEILVNQKLIARGEVVVVNEKFGIRLTDVVSTKERIENLK